MIAIRAARLVDGTGAEAYGPATLLVDGDTIAAVGPAESVAVPEEARVVDLGTATLLPGLVDAHAHFGHDFRSTPSEQLSNYEVLARGVECARRSLLSGVTTARTLGERDFMDVAYRRAIQESWIQGPRVVIAGRALQPSHARSPSCDINTDGVEEIRRVVRQNLRMGTDLVKMYLTPMSAAPDPTLPYYTRAEIEAAVEEARRAGVPVSVHCHGGPSAEDAIALGVDTIEHGVRMTREQLERMAERGIWLVLTQTIRLWEQDESKLSGAHRVARGATRRIAEWAREAGVRVAVGTDGAHGLLWFEPVCLVAAGYSPMEAIQAATGRGAEAIGLGVMTGTLEAGKWADAVAVAGDPLTDIKALRDVVFVMKEGTVFRPGD